MRVLHVVPSVSPVYGGTSTAVLSLVNGLRDTGVDARILTTNAAHGERLQVPTGAWTEYEGVPTLFFSHVLQGGLVTSLGLLRWLRKHVSDFDVVHLHALFSVTTTAAARIASRRGIPYVLTSHGMLEERCLADGRTAKSLYLRLLDLRTLRGASLLQAITVEERETLRGFVDGEIAVCPNPVRVPTAADVRGEASLSHDALLYVGRLDPIKNIELVIDAFHHFAERMSHGALTLVGSGDPSYVASLKARAAGGAGAGRIVFTGALSRPDVLARLRRSAATILVSRSEGLSMTLLESLAAGTPAVVSRAAAPAVIRDSGAVLVSAETPSEVSLAMERIVSSPHTRNALGARASDVAARDFATPMVSSRMKELYQAVLRTRES